MKISYGRYTFDTPKDFYLFLRAKSAISEEQSEIRRLNDLLNSSDLSEFEKAEKLVVCCRLSPCTQKMSVGKNTCVSQETIDRIFTLALSLQANKEREAKADKIISHRNCKSRIK